MHAKFYPSSKSRGKDERAAVVRRKNEKEDEYRISNLEKIVDSQPVDREKFLQFLVFIYLDVYNYIAIFYRNTRSIYLNLTT